MTLEQLSSKLKVQFCSPLLFVYKKLNKINFKETISTLNVNPFMTLQYSQSGVRRGNKKTVSFFLSFFFFNIMMPKGNFVSLEAPLSGKLNGTNCSFDF